MRGSSTQGLTPARQHCAEGKEHMKVRTTRLSWEVQIVTKGDPLNALDDMLAKDQIEEIRVPSIRVARLAAIGSLCDINSQADYADVVRVEHHWRVGVSRTVMQRWKRRSINCVELVPGVDSEGRVG